MTTPAVPVYRNIADLRKRFEPLGIKIRYWSRRRPIGYSAWKYDDRAGYERMIACEEGNTAAEAAQALAERLTEVRYKPKEK